MLRDQTIQKIQADNWCRCFISHKKLSETVACKDIEAHIAYTLVNKFKNYVGKWQGMQIKSVFLNIFIDHIDNVL